MYIVTDEERQATYVYPFVDNAEDAAISVSILVSPLRGVWYNSERFTREDVDRLKAAFDKAFEIVAERTAQETTP